MPREKGAKVDSHGAGLNLNGINSYLTARVSTDHECHKGSEVIERLREVCTFL